jgi:transposase-like protein
MTTRSSSAFSGYRYPDKIIALAVRWYLRYRLSYADVAELLAERGVQVDPSTIYDWVRSFTPRFVAAARRHRSPIGRRWRVDETYLKIGTHWRYLYRAIDEHDQVIDVFLSDRRNADAARTFLTQAIAAGGVTPARVTTDKAKSYPKAIRALLPDVEHRSSKYLNNGLERNHQHLKGRVRPMRRFSQTASASNFCRGHTLIRNLMCGHSTLTTTLPVRQRLAVAWATLATTL